MSTYEGHLTQYELKLWYQLRKKLTKIYRRHRVIRVVVNIAKKKRISIKVNPTKFINHMRQTTLERVNYTCSICKIRSNQKRFTKKMWCWLGLYEPLIGMLLVFVFSVNRFYCSFWLIIKGNVIRRNEILTIEKKFNDSYPHEQR